MMATVI